MPKIDFKELQWPEGLNLSQLVDLLPENVLRAFIAANCHLQRKDRRIILPSFACCKKVLAHRMWKRILDGKTSWEKEKEDLQREFGTIAKVKIKKSMVIKLYKQREREIKKEKGRSCV
jgi:hypothetical protein